MTIGILRQSGTENRIAMLPDEVTVLQNQGVEVIVEWLAGERAFAADKDYLSSFGVMCDFRVDNLWSGSFSLNPYTTKVVEVKISVLPSADTKSHSSRIDVQLSDGTTITQIPMHVIVNCASGCCDSGNFYASDCLYPK